jgi:Ca2+-binding RTX toxin-like protein
MANFNGGPGNDTWHGMNAAEMASGDLGNDHLYGGGGNDTISGNPGNDFLYGERGNDFLYGGLGNDVLGGGSGNDTLYGGFGDDYLIGGPGNDMVYGEAGNDTLTFAYRTGYGTTNNTGIIDGGAGFDTLVLDVRGFATDPFGSGDTYSIPLLRMRDGEGNLGIVSNRVEPNGAYFGKVHSIEAITVAPGSNAVAIEVDQGLTVKGASGNDSLIGSTGDQTFYGGAGADEFGFRFNHLWGGHDEVMDFNKAQGDRIAFDISGSDDPAEAHNIVYSVTEAYDHTIYTIHDYTTGKDVGDVIVNGVGLPEPIGLEIG